MRPILTFICLIVVSGCCHTASKDESFDKIPQIKTRRVTIGQNITMTGKFARSIGGLCIFCEGVEIDLADKNGQTKSGGDEYEQMLGKSVSVTGTLHFIEIYEYADWNNLAWGQHPASHLYFDAETAKIKIE